jgi:hypothetical protein
MHMEIFGLQVVALLLGALLYHMFLVMKAKKA